MTADSWAASFVACDILPEGATAFYSRDNWDIFNGITLLLPPLPQELLIDEIGTAYHYCTPYLNDSIDTHRSQF